MSTAEELFGQAYNLSLFEEKHLEAIDLCRKALEIEPGNYRVLVYLGLLRDHGNPQEISEARRCFVTAIENAKSVSDFVQVGRKKRPFITWESGSGRKATSLMLRCSF